MKQDKAKLKGITYKTRTVTPSAIGVTPLPVCYGQPDCQCMHCQQTETDRTTEEVKKRLVEQGLLKTLGSIMLEGLRQREGG